MRIKLILTAVGLMVLLASCIPEYTGNPSGAKVGVLGDSITDWSKEEIYSYLEPNYLVSVSGNGGKTIGDVQYLADAFRDTYPNKMVIELGTNDAWRTDLWNDSAVYFNMHGMISKFSGASCVAWVTIDTNMGGANWYQLGNAIRVNQMLVEMQSYFPNLVLIDWNAALAYFGRGAMIADGVHPTAFGQLVLADLMSQKVGSC